MSASLIVLIPLVLLGLVGALCFVGCGLSTHGVPTQYENAVLGTNGIVALWPLNEASGLIAFDYSNNNFNGGYVGPPNSFTVGGGPPIVAGEPVSPIFNSGGSVGVGFHPELNPNGSFSIEAWVQVEKMPTPPAVMVVVASNDSNNFTGYQLHATAENTWAASVGLSPGPASQFLIAKPPVGSVPNVVSGVATYLVATFDGNTLTLFVNGQQSAENSIKPGMPPFAPATSPTVFTIALGTDDTQPFNGEIQDVAFYGAVLNQGTITDHFNKGTPPTG